jgi:peptidylprolyl isomerase
VLVKFSVWQPDGKLLDVSKEPIARAVSGPADAAWSEAVQLMVAGEKRTFWVPASLAARERGAAARDFTLVIELLEILPGAKTPPDVKAPPGDATVEKDGLASKILVKGTGTAHPALSSIVTARYFAWSSDGKMFDSWYTKGKPAVFPLNGVIQGWSEVLQLMVEGERRRIWVPEELAFKGRPGHPRGTLCFELELVKIGGDGGPLVPPPSVAGNPCHWAFDQCLASKTLSETCGSDFGKCLGLTQ